MPFPKMQDEGGFLTQDEAELFWKLLSCAFPNAFRRQIFEFSIVYSR